MIRSFLAIALIAGLSLTTVAEETVKTELVAICFNKSMPGYFYRDGNTTRKLEASRTAISIPKSYSGQAILSLFATEAEAKASARSASVAQIVLPSNQSRILLTFTYSSSETEKNSGEDSSKPTVAAHGIGTEDFTEGDYRIFNFSTRKLQFTLQELTQIVNAGEIGSISDPEWQKNTLDLSMKIETENNGKWVKAYSSVWGHQPKRRMFLMIFDRDDRYRPLDVRIFHDIPNP